MKEKIVIVSKGREGGDPESYLEVANVVRQMLLRAPGASENFEVVVVPLVAIALKHRPIKTIVFVTGEPINTAKHFKEFCPETRVVVFTSLSDQNQLQDGIYVLTKPIDSKTLRSFVLEF